MVGIVGKVGKVGKVGSWQSKFVSSWGDNRSGCFAYYICTILLYYTILQLYIQGSRCMFITLVTS